MNGNNTVLFLRVTPSTLAPLAGAISCMETLYRYEPAANLAGKSPWRPHSLGQSVEWKHRNRSNDWTTVDMGPTRWGNQLNGNNIDVLFGRKYSCNGPHSLGQSVEWKPFFSVRPLVFFALPRGPTRWGNQLNGNSNRFDPNGTLSKRPHSLGQSVEWKLIYRSRYPCPLNWMAPLAGAIS